MKKDCRNKPNAEVISFGIQFIKSWSREVRRKSRDTPNNQVKVFMIVYEDGSLWGIKKLLSAPSLLFTPIPFTLQTTIQCQMHY